jgi:peptide deformylase
VKTHTPMRLKIVQVGEPVLREQARLLKRDEIRSPSIQQLIELMRETMYDAPGVGLAAPQVGLSLQLAVIEDKPEYTANSPADRLKEREREPVPFHVIVNPRITLHEGDSVEFYEGCLSFPSYAAKVKRARRVRVDCLDHKGESKVIDASGWYARILQHEVDHLSGTVFVDRMDTRTLATVDNLNRYHGGIFGRKS